MLYLVEDIGKKVLHVLFHLGEFAQFLLTLTVTAFSTRLKIKQAIAQIERIGVGGLIIISLTGLCTGFVLALQANSGFKKFGAQDMIGVIVALAMFRELGPVLSGLLVAGRSGSALTAEIGTMKITEQIDALQTLHIDVFQYLLIPRIFACAISLPLLTIISMASGVLGGYIYCTSILNVNPENYLGFISQNIEFIDIFGGILKSFIFGLILSIVGIYLGYKTEGGAKGVGISTTKSVVFSSILILAADFVLSTLIFSADFN